MGAAGVSPGGSPSRRLRVVGLEDSRPLWAPLNPNTLLSSRYRSGNAPFLLIPG